MKQVSSQDVFMNSVIKMRKLCKILTVAANPLYFQRFTAFSPSFCFSFIQAVLTFTARKTVNSAEIAVKKVQAA